MSMMSLLWAYTENRRRIAHDKEQARRVLEDNDIAVAVYQLSDGRLIEKTHHGYWAYEPGDGSYWVSAASLARTTMSWNVQHGFWHDGTLIAPGAILGARLKDSVSA